jgi:hypothetical protein
MTSSVAEPGISLDYRGSRRELSVLRELSVRPRS